MKGWKKIFHANRDQKKAGVAILISDKIDFKTKTVKRDKDGHYIMIKGSIQEEDITIINIYAPNTGAPQYVRQMLTSMKGEINNNTIIVGDFNTPLTPMDRSTKQKINKETQTLNDTIDQLDLIDIYRTFHPKTMNFTFFSSAHGTFSRIDHILGHKASIGKFKKIEIIPSIFSDHNAVRLDLNYRRKTIKKSNIWRLNNTLLAIHPNAEADADAGVYLFANWNNTLTDSRRYIEYLEKLYAKIRPDAARYAPASALPSNAASLIYCGFDLFDYTAVDLCTIQGKFCTTEGEFEADYMEKGICGCEGCRAGDLKLHNRLALEREIANARLWIERGQIREYMEMRCRMQPEQVEILRRIDRTDAFDGLYPAVRSSRFRANAGESMFRREIALFEERLVSRYVPPRSDICVLLPCASRKPYSLSRSHQNH